VKALRPVRLQPFLLILPFLLSDLGIQINFGPICSGGAADFESFTKGINKQLGSSDPDGPETPNAQ
jgi:hypothetical protein